MTLRQALATLLVLDKADDLDPWEMGEAIRLRADAEALRVRVVALIDSYMRRQAALQKETE